MPYQIELARGWPYKRPTTYGTWIEAQRGFLRTKRLWPAIPARVVCTGIGVKEAQCD